jgi:hypothetical protein
MKFSLLVTLVLASFSALANTDRSFSFEDKSYRVTTDWSKPKAPTESCFVVANGFERETKDGRVIVIQSYQSSGFGWEPRVFAITQKKDKFLCTKDRSEGGIYTCKTTTDLKDFKPMEIQFLKK